MKPCNHILKYWNKKLKDPNLIEDMGMTQIVCLQSFQISLNVDKFISLHEVPFDLNPVSYKILMVPLITSICANDMPSSNNPINPPHHFGL